MKTNKGKVSEGKMQDYIIKIGVKGCKCILKIGIICGF